MLVSFMAFVAGVLVCRMFWGGVPVVLVVLVG